MRDAVFLDGREKFWSHSMLCALDELQAVTEAQPLNFIFHTGFCGSTLLAQLLDRPGQRFVLKEPQALADFASQLPALRKRDGNEGANRVLAILTGALAGSGPRDESLIIKPSSWINPLLPFLCEQGLIARAVFVAPSRRDFLSACFRGGRDRLAFCAELAQLLGQLDPAMAGELRTAIASTNEPLDRIARIVALLHAQQLSLFEQAAGDLGAQAAKLIEPPMKSGDPLRPATEMAAYLAPESDPRPSTEASGILKRDAKDPKRPFAPQAEQDRNAEIERHHADRLDDAIAWLDKTLPQRVSAAASR